MRRFDRLACLGLGLLPFLGALALLLQGETYYLRDVHFHVQPLTAVWQRALQAGQIPFWNPLLGAGMPLAAAMQLPVFYPPLILFYYLPYDRALLLYVALHEALLGLATYALCRWWGWRGGGAWLAALAFVFSGPVVSLHNIYEYEGGLALLPLVTLLFLRTARLPGWGPWLQLGLAFGLQLATVRHEISLMTGLLLALITAGEAWRGRPPRALARAWLAPLAVTATLGLPILLPAAEMLGQSNRHAGVGLAESAGVAFPPVQALTLLVPRLLAGALEQAPAGTELTPGLRFRPFLVTVYLGILPLLLGATGALAGRPPARLLAAGVGLALLLALGTHTPVYGWLYAYAPLLHFTRFPIKFFLLAAFCWCLLAGLGWDRLAAGRPSVRRAAWWMLTLLPVLVVAEYALAHPVRARAAVEAAYGAWLGHPVPAGWVTDRLWEAVAADLRGLVVAWTAAAVALALLARRRLAPPATLAVATAVLLADLWLNTRAFDDRAPRAFLLEPPPLARYLSGLPDRGRLYYPLGMATYPVALLRAGQGPSYARENLIERRLLLFNTGMAFDLGHLDAYGNMLLDTPAGLIRALQARPGGLSRPRELALAGLFDGATVVLPLPGPASALREQALRAEAEYGATLLALVAEDQAAVLRNPWARGPAYFVPDARVAGSPADVAAALGAPALDLATTVVLQDDAALQETLGIRARAARRASGITRPGCVATRRELNAVDVSCRQPVSGYLVLPDSHYPGWVATVDGQKRPVLRANALARAVYLEAGVHEVAFRYRPGWFPWTLAVAMAALAAGLALAARTRR